MKKGVWHLVTLLGVVVMTCVVGHDDYVDEVLYNMSDGTYEILREKLGDVSSSVLVETYMEDQAYWDSLGRLK